MIARTGHAPKRTNGHATEESAMPATPPPPANPLEDARARINELFGQLIVTTLKLRELEQAKEKRK